MTHGISLAILPLDKLKHEIRQSSGNSESSLILIDARTSAEFAEGHIPGAISISWEDWCDPAPKEAPPVLCQCGYWGALADPVLNQAAARLTSLGIANDSKVVVYANGVESKGRDGRIAWMLLYFGATNVSLLDEGFDAWIASGGAIEKSDDTSGCNVIDLKPALSRSSRIRLAEGASTRFVLNLQETRRVLFEDVWRRFGSARSPFLIDTRSVEEFQGWIYDYQPRLGRIPGAISFPFSEMFGSNGRYISACEYTELLRDAIGSIGGGGAGECEKDDPSTYRFGGTQRSERSENLSGIQRSERSEKSSIIAYCEVGVRAASVALLHEIYTGEVIPVYDASFMEWSLRAENPVACDVAGAR